MTAAKTSPPDVESSSPRPPSGGESTTPIWDELADRWAVVKTLQAARAVDEEAADA